MLMGSLHGLGRYCALRRSFQEFLQEWPGTVCGLDFWTLDFPTSLQEQHFVEKRKAGVAKTLSFCCLFAMLVSVTSTIWMLVLATSDQMTPTMRKIVLTQMVMAIFTGTCAVMLWVLCRVPYMFQRIGAKKLEIIGTLCMTLGMCTSAFCDQHHLIKMMGHSPQDEWVKTGGECYHHSHVVIILSILGITQAGNMMVPIRWKVVLPMNLIGLLSYITSTSIFSLDHKLLFNLLFIVAILSMTTLGKRMLEIKERKAHCDLLSAKKMRSREMRCMAEFKLSHLKTDRFALASDQKSYQKSDQNLESSELTEQVFANTPNSPEQSDMDSFIEKVAKLGKQEHWCVASDELQLMTNQVLGKGEFGKVVRGVFHGAAVAVKIIADSTDSQALQKQVLPLCNELRVIRQLRHPNIVGLHGALLDARGLALVVELVDGVTLECYVLQKPMPRTVFRYSAIYGVSCGLEYLHSRKPRIVHGDVKGSNVMVELRGETVRAKVLDFGLSRILSGKPKPAGGTLAWMAPEVYRTPKRPPEPSSDVFSFGRLLYFALAGTMPFSRAPTRQVRHMLKSALIPTLTLPGRHAVEECLADLLDSCLKVDALQRPSMQTVQSTLVEAALQYSDLAPCVSVALLPETMQTDEGRNMEAFCTLRGTGRHLNEGRNMETSSQNLAQQLPQDSFSQDASNEICSVPVVAGNTCSHQQEEEQQQQQEQEQSSAGLSAELLSDRLAQQSLLPTRTGAMCASLLITVQGWNFPLPRVSCCPYHASMKTLRQVTESLAHVDCQQDFGPTGSGQCQRCGLMFDFESRACELCGCINESALPSIQEEEHVVVSL